MPIVILIFGAILIVAAYKNTYGTLFSNLQSDVPGFAVWFAAIAVVGGLQYVPGLKVPARWLLALVLLVLFMSNYQRILSGIQSASSGAGSSTAAVTDPATQYATNATAPTSAQVSGTSSTSSSSGNVNSVQQAASVISSYDPNTYLTAFLSNAGFGAA